MDKKKLIILLSSLFLLLLLGIFIIIGTTNGSNDRNENKDNNATNTSQIKGETNYNHSDVDGDYAKMIKEAEEKEKLAKLEKEKLAKLEEEKKTKEKKAQSKEKKNQENKSSATSNSNNDKIVTQYGKKYIVDSSGGMIPLGEAGTDKAVKTTKSKADLNKGITPIYKKYEVKPDKSVINKKTKETKILHKFLDKKKNIQIVNSSVSTKGNSNAAAYIKNSEGKIVDTLVRVSNRAGSAKQYHDKNLHYGLSFNEDYINSNTAECYSIAKAFGIPVSKGEFINTYKKYKNGKLTDSDYKKSFSIGYNGMEVTVEW